MAAVQAAGPLPMIITFSDMTSPCRVEPQYYSAIKACAYTRIDRKPAMPYDLVVRKETVNLP